MQRGFEADGDRTAAAVTAGMLWFYWYQRGVFTEGRRWLEQAIEADVTPVATARCLLGVANLERVQGNLTEAKDHGLRALDLFRDAGDDEGKADALSQLGAICQYLNETDEAELYLNEAVPLLRQIGARGQLSFTLVLLGALKQLRSDLDGAEADYRESLSLGRELDDRNYIATSLVNLGEVLQLKGDLDGAGANFKESLLLFHTLGVRNAIAYCLEMLAGIDMEQNRLREATVLFGAADKLREVLGTPIESFNEDRYRANLERCRNGIGDEAYAAAWKEGREMPLDDAVQVAQIDEDVSHQDTD